MGSQQEPTGERSSARTSGTTPSSVHQATGGVQRVTSPLKAASSMKHSGGEDSDDEKWFSGDEDDLAYTRRTRASRGGNSRGGREAHLGAYTDRRYASVVVCGRARRTCLPV